MTTAQQLPLRFRLDNDATFENYCPLGADFVIHELKRQAAGDQGNILLTGGAGKSHLLQASCALSWELGRDARYIPLADMLNHPPEAVLDGACDHQLICLDDIDLAVGCVAWEKAVFNLYNQLLENGGALLVSSRASFADLNFSLADLKSRLGGFAVFAMQSPSDDELAKVLSFRGAKRGLNLDHKVSAYILSRSRRDLVTLVDMLQDLDEASMRSKKRITVPFVKSVFQW